MTNEDKDPKDVARRYVEVAWNDGTIEEMDNILTEHQVYHDPTGSGEEPLAEFKDFI